VVLFQRPPSEPRVSLSISRGSPVIYAEGQPSSAAFSDDAQDGFGGSHLAYLTSLVVRSPVPLRPAPGVSRAPWAVVTPPTPTGTPSPSGSRPVGDPTFRRCWTYRARRRRLTHPLESVRYRSAARRRVRPAKAVRAGPGSTAIRRCGGECAVPPLEIEVQAMRLSPYRTGLAGRHRQRLRVSPASLTCSCPLQLSPSGESDGPEVSLRTSPGCTRYPTSRAAAHGFLAHGSSVRRPRSWAPWWAGALHSGASPCRVIQTSLAGGRTASPTRGIPITDRPPSPRQPLRGLAPRPWLLGASPHRAVSG